MKPTKVSVKEVAQELGVSVQSIRRAYWRGDIPAYRICILLVTDRASRRGYSTRQHFIFLKKKNLPKTGFH